MAKLQIAGDYELKGEHLIRLNDGQILHIQRNKFNSKKPQKKTPPLILVHIDRLGHRERLSGLFPISAGNGVGFSFDHEGQNYKLAIEENGLMIVGSIQAKGMKKATKEATEPKSASRVLALFGNFLAAGKNKASLSQLHLW